MSPLPSNFPSHSESLALSRQAPQYLEKQPDVSVLASVPFLSTPESPELWMMYEQLLLSCLRTGDEKSAHLCLERLTARFGASNERVMGLTGLCQEAVAENDAALERVLEEYNAILSDDPTVVPVLKRRVALLKTLHRSADAIAALVQLLEMSPTDVEAWAELSDLYLAEALYAQSCFCLEEVLLITPNAWNIHARLGEVLYISTLPAGSAADAATEKALVQAVRRYCRSIELCDGYLRGYYGLKIATDRLIKLAESAKAAASPRDGNQIPPNVLQDLNRKAQMKLEDIVKQHGSGINAYDAAEIISAKALLGGTS